MLVIWIRGLNLVIIIYKGVFSSLSYSPEIQHRETVLPFNDCHPSGGCRKVDPEGGGGDVREKRSPWGHSLNYPRWLPCAPCVWRFLLKARRWIIETATGNYVMSCLGGVRKERETNSLFPTVFIECHVTHVVRVDSHHYTAGACSNRRVLFDVEVMIWTWLWKWSVGVANFLERNDSTSSFSLPPPLPLSHWSVDIKTYFNCKITKNRDVLPIMASYSGTFFLFLRFTRL